VADYDKVIPPGQEGKIRAKIVGRKLHPGHFKKNFKVRTNDPENQTIVLYLTNNVKKVFDIKHNLNLMGFTEDDMKGDAVVTNLLDTPIRITGYKWKANKYSKLDFDKVLKVKIDEIEKGKKYKVYVRKKANIKPGRYQADLILLTDYPKLREKALNFNITVTPDVSLQPERLFFGEMRVTEGVSKSFDRMFSVVATRGDSLKVLKVVPESERVTVALEEVRPGKAYKCTVRVRPELKNGPFRTSIKVYTNYPGYREMTVYVQGTVHVIKPDKK